MIRSLDISSITPSFPPNFPVYRAAPVLARGREIHRERSPKLANEIAGAKSMLATTYGETPNGEIEAISAWRAVQSELGSKLRNLEGAPAFTNQRA